MKYFSEKLNKTFDDVESLEKAEKDFEEAEKKKAVEVDEKAKTRKELAKKVEEAELSVSSAYDKLEQVKKECAKILDESNKQVSDMLDAAYDIIKKAEEAKCEAINKYNEECGTYTKYYTGRKAVEELIFWRNKNEENCCIAYCGRNGSRTLRMQPERFFLRCGQDYGYGRTRDQP